MRLVCPNCDAEYEVDGAAIPLTGRDVQCSNCGHAWFQTHPDLTEPAVDEPVQAVAESRAEPAVAGPASQPEPTAAAQASTGPAPAAAETAAAATAGAATAGAETTGAETAGAATAGAETTGAETAGAETTGAETAAAATAAAAPVPGPQPVPLADQTPAAPRNIDESVLAVLREEAEREALARKAEAKAPALETQTEMPLAPLAAVPRQGARPVAMAATEPEAAAEPEAATRPRRELFPAIEEVNSTLRATSDRAGDAASDEETLQARAKAEAGGFGRGFLTLVLIGVILLALYVFAPLIGANVPALASTAQAYVAAVDAARLWLDGEIRTLVGWLRGLEGGTKG